MNPSSAGSPPPPASTSTLAARATGKRVLGFAVVSGVGWLIDVVVFWLLLQAGNDAFLANAAGASLATTWVYCASVRSVFRYRGDFLFVKFLVYVGFQIVAIAAASFAIDQLCGRFPLAPLLAKILVTPATFIVNYLFMARLTRPTPSSEAGDG